MGLAEKRGLNELHTKAWPGYLARIQAAATNPIEVAPIWESLFGPRTLRQISLSSSTELL